MTDARTYRLAPQEHPDDARLRVASVEIVEDGAEALLVVRYAEAEPVSA